MSLSREISSWQAQDFTADISSGPDLLGGLSSVQWTHASGISGGTSSPGRTIIMPAKAFYNACTIKKIKFYVSTQAGTDNWKFKVFRKNGSNYDYVAEEAIAVSGTGVKEHTLATPISVNAGDIPGIFIPLYSGGVYNNIGAKTEDVAGNPDLRYTTGDITTSNAFSSTLKYFIELECLTDAIEVIHGGGIDYRYWRNTSGMSGGTTTPGRTIINPARAFRQAGKVAGIFINVQDYVSGNNVWKFKIFRWNGTNFSYVSETSFTVTGPGALAYEFETPVDVQVGDIPGIFAPYTTTSNYNQVGLQADAATLPLRYTTGDITSANAFSSTMAYLVEMDCLMQFPPFLAIIGDSKAEGHNNGGGSSANSYHTEFHDTTVVNALPGGVQTSEILYELAELAAMNYQNVGKGSQTFANLSATYAAVALAAKPKILLIECGVNDVSTARAWSAVEDDLDTIYSLFQASDSELLLIDEILPWTAGDATQASTIRTWNDNLATWATGKSDVAIVECHDLMKDPENVDDMLPAYDFDGVHLTTAGVAALADIIYDKLLDIYRNSLIVMPRSRQFNPIIVR